MRKHRRLLSEVVSHLLVIMAFGGLFFFIFVNWVSECESYDPQYQTKESRCYTPAQLVRELWRNADQ